MQYTLALQTPESPVKEEWVWTTDLMTAYAGDEDRIPLNRYPKRVFSGNYSFDRIEDVRRHMALMFQRHRGKLELPLFQHAVKLKSAAALGTDTIAVNAKRSDLRQARKALLIEGDTFETLTVEDMTDSSVTFTTPLVNDYSARALLCPVTRVYSASGAQFSRLNPDHRASASFSYMEDAPWSPFVSPLNDAALTMFDGKAVLDLNAVGTQFDESLLSGINITEYIGLPDVFSPWLQSQWTFGLTWQSNRVLDLAAWLWWYKFADHVQGSSIPFLLPTFREDMEFMPPGSFPGLEDVPDTIIVKGTEYSDHYWPLDTFKRIVLDSAGGRHYAIVTAVDQVDGNDRLTISPPHPSGAPWFDIHRVGFLLKVRIADDKITCDHYGLHTDVSMALQTVA